MIINNKLLNKIGLTLDEYLVLILLKRGVYPEALISKFIKEHKVRKVDGEYIFDNEEVEKELLKWKDSTEEVEFLPEKTLEEVANEMRELFPTGIKDGTKVPWRGSTNEITQRLKMLQRYTNKKLDVSKIVDATKLYIKSFNGDFRFMQTLKYFIFKQVNTAGMLEIKSDLLAYIDMLDQGVDLENPELKDDWISQLK